MEEEKLELDLFGYPIRETQKATQNKDLHAVFVTCGASNHSNGQRQAQDFYATEPIAAELLLQLEDFKGPIWEPCCGQGHLSRVFEAAGFEVKSTDLVDRGYSPGGGVNFLDSGITAWKGDIITNPPFAIAQEIIEKALKIVPEGYKVAMFLRTLFLEGIRRRALFEEHPPRKIWVASKRIKCAKNGDFSGPNGGVLSYSWFVWEKGYKGSTQIGWFN